MNILHIINALEMGGAERLLANSLPLLKQMGHNVRVALLFSTGSEMERQLADGGIEVDVLGKARHAYDPRLAWRLRRIMPWADVVHVHLFPSQYWAALAHKSCHGSILVTTEHSTSNTRAHHWLTSAIDRWIYGMYDGIICISDATADFMRQRVPGNVKIETIENGIVLPDADVVAALGDVKRSEVVPGIADDDFLMLQVARFSDQKNQDCVIRSLPLLPDNVHVAFAGYGVRLEACRQLAESLGVGSRTHFLGIREDIARLWSVADMGVMSSHWEGFGLAAVEGMAYGKPVMASDVPGLADVVMNRDLLFAPDDERVLAKKIMPLYSDAARCHEYGEWCRQRAQVFDIRNMVDCYVDFYKERMVDKKK